MSDNDYFEQIEDIEDTKPTKKGRKLTEEQKKINIDNLKRGREKALENRKKKAELKKLQKLETEIDLNNKLKTLKQKVAKTDEKQQVEKKPEDNDVLLQLNELKKELQHLKSLKVEQPIKPIEPVKPVEEPIKQIEQPIKQVEVIKQVEPIKPKVNNFMHSRFTSSLYNV
jgi:uncharacterized protein with von Willebrand factor type A (vWA) domain